MTATIGIHPGIPEDVVVSPPVPMKPGSGRSVSGAKMPPGRLPSDGNGTRTGSGIWSRYAARS